MNENINLCEILKDCGSIKLYSSIFGDVELTAVYSELTEFPIKVTSKDCYIQSFRKDGKYYDGGGECVLFPSKEQRDWSKFERPIPIDTPVMVNHIELVDNDLGSWKVAYYKGNNTVSFYKDSRIITEYTVIISTDKFDFRNPENSLKYNIVK